MQEMQGETVCVHGQTPSQCLQTVWGD